MQKALLARSLEDYEKRSMHQAVDPEGAYADYFVMCVRTGGPGAKGLFDAPGGAQGMHGDQTDEDHLVHVLRHAEARDRQGR